MCPERVIRPAGETRAKVTNFFISARKKWHFIAGPTAPANNLLALITKPPNDARLEIQHVYFFHFLPQSTRKGCDERQGSRNQS